MSDYFYRATDDCGNSLEGQLTAPSKQAAIEQLERQGLVVASMDLITANDDSDRSRSDDHGLPGELVRARAVDNVRQWAGPMMALAQEVSSRPVSKAIQRIAERLQSVEQIEQIVTNPATSEYFPMTVQGLADNRSADLMLTGLVHRIELNRQKQQWLRYPLLLFFACSLFYIFLYLYIVPTFRQIYVDFGAKLSVETQLLLGVGELFSWSGVPFLLGILGAVMGACWGWLRIRHHGFLHRYFPIITIGSRHSLRAVGLIVSNFAELISPHCQYPVGQSLRLAAQGSDHRFYRRLFMQLADQFESSSSVDSRLFRRYLPPLLMSQLESGKPDPQMLRAIGKIYIDRDNIASLMMPMWTKQLFIFVIGSVVGLTIVLLLLPLVRLIQDMGQY